MLIDRDAVKFEPTPELRGVSVSEDKDARRLLEKRLQKPRADLAGRYEYFVAVAVAHQGE